MLVPTTIDLKMFQSFMKVGIKPDFDPQNVFYGTIVEQESQNTTETRRLEISEDPLKFNFSIESFKPDLMTM
jgi:hypothetical protein